MNRSREADLPPAQRVTFHTPDGEFAVIRTGTPRKFGVREFAVYKHIGKQTIYLNSVRGLTFSHALRRGLNAAAKVRQRQENMYSRAGGQK